MTGKQKKTMKLNTDNAQLYTRSIYLSDYENITLKDEKGNTKKVSSFTSWSNN